MIHTRIHISRGSIVLTYYSVKLLAGKLSDIVGRRPVLLVLTTLFFIGSVGCGYASGLTQMIVFRAIAGLGGGGLNLMGNIVIHDLLQADQRNRYLSYISTVQTVSEEKFILFSYTDTLICIRLDFPSDHPWVDSSLIR